MRTKTFQVFRLSEAVVFFDYKITIIITRTFTITSDHTGMITIYKKILCHAIHELVEHTDETGFTLSFVNIIFKLTNEILNIFLTFLFSLLIY